MNTNAYQNLYESVRKHFTVDCDGHDGTLGEYMQNRALTLRTQSLPVRSFSLGGAVTLTAIAHYLQDKMTVKVPPVKDRTIRSFPIRTSMSAALSAVTVCGLLFTFTVLGAQAVTYGKAKTVSYAEQTEDEIPEEKAAESENL